MGCGKGAQTRDMLFCLSQSLEKGRDRLNACAVAMGVIKKCHDVIPWGAAMRGFLNRGISSSIASAVLRVMRCPRLSFTAGAAVSNFILRTRSVLTGNPLAGMVARVVIEDSLSLARPRFVNTFALDDDFVLDALSWSDNLSCIASSIDSAIHNLQIWAGVLNDIFNMHLKSNSKVVVPSRTRIEGDSVVRVGESDWRVVDRELVLGSWLTATGEDASERHAVHTSWNSIFWKHSKSLVNLKAMIISRLRFWKPFQ